MIAHTWSGGTALLWLATLGAGVFALWSLLDRQADTIVGIWVPLAFVVLAAGSAGVLALSGSALLGQLAGVLAAMAGAAALTAFLWKGVSIARGAVPVFVLILLGLWIAGYFYAEVPLASVLLLVHTPVLVGLAGKLAGHLPRPWMAGLARSAAVLVPVGIALALALAAQPEPGPYDAYY
jgi:hypothetical protein